jgi:hypothetical protein
MGTPGEKVEKCCLGLSSAGLSRTACTAELGALETGVKLGPIAAEISQRRAACFAPFP